MFNETYSDCEYRNIKQAMFVMCNLFRELALKVAEHNKFIYPIKDDKNMVSYLNDTLKYN